MWHGIHTDMFVMCFSCEHFGMSVDDFMGDKFSKQSGHDICLHTRTAKDYC